MSISERKGASDFLTRAPEVVQYDVPLEDAALMRNEVDSHTTGLDNVDGPASELSPQHSDPRLRDVTSVTFATVTGDVRPARWIMLLIKLPSNPSRHRVAVWRQLSKAGALSVGQGVWAAPDVPAFAAGITRALELTDQAGGEAISLYASGVTTGDAARFEATFTSAREDEWTEFVADCGKYEVELDKEISNAKFTLAELEEEEQSLERLQRWHRDITARDVFGAPGAADAEQRLRHCTERFADYTERVFAALHAPDGSTGGVL